MAGFNASPAEEYEPFCSGDPQSPRSPKTVYDTAPSSTISSSFPSEATQAIGSPLPTWDLEHGAHQHLDQWECYSEQEDIPSNEYKRPKCPSRNDFPPGIDMHILDLCGEHLVNCIILLHDYGQDHCDENDEFRTLAHRILTKHTDILCIVLHPLFKDPSISPHAGNDSHSVSKT